MATNVFEASLIAPQRWSEDRICDHDDTLPNPKAPCLGLALVAAAALWAGMGSVLAFALTTLA